MKGITHRALMTLPGNTTAVKDAVLGTIRSGLCLSGSNVSIGTKKHAQLVQWMLKNEYVTYPEVSKAIHDGLCRVGREVYDWHQRNPRSNYPDHSMSPEALGYAIAFGTVTKREAARIRFDHNETVDEYLKLADSLLDHVMQQITEGTSFFAVPVYEESSHDCHSCFH